jgi:hypothetical protein
VAAFGGGVEQIQNGGCCHGNQCTAISMATAAILKILFYFRIVTYYW